MGQAESSQVGTSSSLHDPQLGHNTVAFHVLRVAENSPAAQAGLDPFFDFIVGVNGTQLGEDIDTFTQILEENQARQVGLMVYSTKRKEIRDVYVVPSSEWSSNGVQASVDDQPSLLGLSLRLCNPQHALEQVWHVLEVLEGSPAQSAGLVPFGDWIIGYSGGVLRGEGDFYDVVESHTDKPLRLFVYNSDYDVTRETILVPNRTWGGEGLLGAGVGYGLLHRIPKPQDHRPRLNNDNDNEQYRAPRPPTTTTSQYRSPPPRSSSSASLTSPPPKSSTTIPPPPSSSSSSNVTSHQPAPPPPPRRTAAISPPRSNNNPLPPPTSSSRSKYIPPPPPSVTSPTRSTTTTTTTTTTTNNNQQQQKNSYSQQKQHPSFQSGGQGQFSTISFGGGGEEMASQGVELIPTRNDDDDDEVEEEEDDSFTSRGASRNFDNSVSPPPAQRGYGSVGGSSSYGSYGGRGGGSPYRTGGGARQTAIIEE